MHKLLTSNKVYVTKSKIKNAGRGIFAACSIKKGEVIEICPIIIVSKDDTSNLNESLLVTYFFYFGAKKEKLAVILGFGSLYNHSYKPNAKYKLDEKNQTVVFISLKDIKRNDEITFNYKGGIELKKQNIPLWFEA